MSHDDGLDLFLPPVRQWFRSYLGKPTPVQQEGWPVIAAGKNALLLAPTGSGKTLAAFLACLDGLWRQSEVAAEGMAPGVQVLYVSPLKALNNDIHRNLQAPLNGVAAAADFMRFPLSPIEVAVRTGDTPTAERQRLLRKPPHILITTPESLHLLLTSKARQVLRNVTHCIVDEIHALCPNKRGVFLALLLERLQAINSREFVRIGLSATQRPLEEVARFLGGYSRDSQDQWCERPVTIVDAGLRKELDLQVVSPVEQFGPLPEKSIWPSIYRRLAQEIREHRSTIVFANNRRTVERLTAQLNEYLSEDSVRDGDALAEPREQDIQVRAHHGSVALEVRRQTEQALKEGRLRAVVATASLELGIDMGAVDLVCQVESPGNVARGLQRVGRAGHLVGQSSKGRLIAKTLPDLLNLAVLASEMSAGRVEELRVPINCLDVLAQQVIAMTAMDDWSVSELFTLVRQSYPYRDLTPGAFDAVLEMVSGRFRFGFRDGEGSVEPAVVSAQQLAALQPRISWDRVHQKLQALPGSQRLALVHGGTIPDTGQYAVYTIAGLRLGEVDEEFVYERRIGDTFLLGTNAWQIDRIDTDRVLVHPAEGLPAMAPFWRGEATGRSYGLGLAQGRFLCELAKRINEADCLDWLQLDHHLDLPAAKNLRDFVRRQIARTRSLPTDTTLLIEASRDPLGDWQVILLCPLGRAVNLSLRLALEARLKERLGYRPQCLHHDDGVLIRLTESEEPVLDLFDGITPENVRDLILEELGDSALFALRFRQNAARALMMPRGAAGKRAPLWLQRLRGRDLLQVARRHADFPIVVETFRECLHDHLDLPRVQELLAGIAVGKIAIETCRPDMPSPFGANLLFAFTMAYMYQYDDVEPGLDRNAAAIDQKALDELIGQHGEVAGGVPIDPRAAQQLDRRLRGGGLPPRNKAETAEWLRQLGDISPSELEGSTREFLEALSKEGTVEKITLPTCADSVRWILTEDAALYLSAFRSGTGGAVSPHDAAARILSRFLETHALVGLDDILRRYPFERDWAQRQLEEWTRQGRLLRVLAKEAEPLQWSAPANFEQMQRGTLSIHRREVLTCPSHQFAEFLMRWQHIHPENPATLSEVMHRLHGCVLPVELWEHALLPLRCSTFASKMLDDMCATGAWTWYGRRLGEGNDLVLGFVPRQSLTHLPAPVFENPDGPAGFVVEALRSRGAQFLVELASVTKLSEDALRLVLWSLLKAGIVTNDRFEVVRRGEPPSQTDPPPLRSRAELRFFLRESRRRSFANASGSEGRWSLVPWGQPDPESAALFQSRLLLERFGIVARELAILAGTPIPWRVLYEILSRLELAGEVRRGYFVEGLSGAQFALPEAVSLLADLGLPSAASAPVLLVHSLDPANLYGSGAVLETDTPFQRRAANWLTLKAGRPVMFIEQNGKRLTTSPRATPQDVSDSVAKLVRLLKLTPSRDVRHRLTVETWNDQPVTATVGKELLEKAGFVRDYQAMTLYAVWQANVTPQ